jgi:cytochrome c553
LKRHTSFLDRFQIDREAECRARRSSRSARIANAHRRIVISSRREIKVVWRSLPIALVLILIAAATQMLPEQPSFEGANSTGAAQLKHGDRLLSLLDCRGCHGADLQGHLFVDRPEADGVIWSFNLTLAAPSMSEAELRNVLTRGMHPQRRDLWIMPSNVYQHLSDADLAALIAALRALEPAGEPAPAPVIGPKPDITAAARTVEWADRLPVDAGPRHRWGRYIATAACTVCHGAELEGNAGFSPDLAIAAGYDRQQFETLLTKGVPIGGRQLHELMQSAARENAAKMTVRERDALYAYLVARADAR